MADSPRRLEGISFLRLIATTGIMLYHIGFGHYYFQFVNLASGVHLFLCISAFLFMYTTQTKTAGVFLKNRLIRIVPLYAILTVLTYIAANFMSSIYQDGAEISELFKSILFIPYSRGSLKGGDVVRPLVGPAWTLYYDIWFAVIFACSMGCSKKWRGLISVSACALLYAIGFVLPEELVISRFLTQIFWFDFAVGVGVFYVWKFVSCRKCLQNSKLNGIVAVVSILLLYLGPNREILLLLECFLILISALLFSAQQHAPKVVSRFADLSYSFYLVHYYIIIIIGRIIDFSDFSIKTILGVICVFFVTLLTSHCSYELIEVKLGKVLKKWIL